ncbi:DUF2164 domain-containing protein [Psychrobacter sp. ANT_H56B]|uniref:DUF2164 domain-containing protein n=1 Tax=unclassified Psychrobacter TaxID=196806 RepID=UPI0011EDB3EC|nr:MULTISPECIES: DUF2164 domain-containing protein [unclassified Psychrobacter]KAA0928843.1 DUF2164 domain-containing protein [Psychrobacter sp. ANT_H56B]KAA0938448.1 DUF2164 domain-containing protein [Psychrobacter sp. ANT_H59]
MNKDKPITLSDETEILILDQLRVYMNEEFDIDIGNLPAKFLLDFIIETVGPHFYNQVVDDMEPWLYERFTGMLEDMHSFKKD